MLYMLESENDLKFQMPEMLKVVVSHRSVVFII